MNDSVNISDRTEPLVAALLDGRLSEEQADELRRLLLEYPSARRQYARQAALHAMLQWISMPADSLAGDNNGISFHRLVQKEQRQEENPSLANVDLDTANEDALAASTETFSIPADQAVSVPPLGFLGAAYHGTANFFSQDVPFACLMSALFMIVGGIIGSLITKEHYTQMPGLSSASAERSYASGGAAAGASDTADKMIPSEKATAKSPWIGEITGKVDCVWANNKTAPFWHKFGINDKFELKSGLVEITYYSGAKVILQGPCTYEVDSVAGGYLSLGKLTARVEKKGAGDAGRGTGEEKVQGSRSKVQDSDSSSLNLEPLALNLPPNPQSPIPNPLPSPAPRPQSPAPLFAVRTTTATVTDLGTEFGVEVDAQQTTQMTVFQGEVEFSSLVKGTAPRLQKRFKAGQSASLDSVGVLRQNSAIKDAQKVFARDFRKAATAAIARNRDVLREQFRKDPALVAYYAFDNEKESPDRLLNRAATTAGRLDGILGQPGEPDTRPTWADGRGPGRRALRFEAGKLQAVRVPHDDALNLGGSMTVAAWVKPKIQPSSWSFPILSRRGVEEDALHFQLAVMGPQSDVPLCIQFCTPRPSAISSTYSRFYSVPDGGEWMHVAVTYVAAARDNPGTKKFYLNGRLVNAIKCDSPAVESEDDLWIGAVPPWLAAPSYCFDGLIGEIWIFKRVLSSAEIANLDRLVDFVENPQTP